MLNKEYFAIKVEHILEVIELPIITYVPNCSPFIKGVINFRGEIVPVIDMHKRFNKVRTKNKYEIIIIIKLVTQEQKMNLGLLVDSVDGVISFSTKNIKNIPDTGLKYNSQFVNGMIDFNNEFIMMVNLEKSLNPKELAEYVEI